MRFQDHIPIRVLRSFRTSSITAIIVTVLLLSGRLHLLAEDSCDSEFAASNLHCGRSRGSIMNRSLRRKVAHRS